MKCGRILVPPRMFCEEDFRETDGWVEVKDRGTVKTYSISYLNADASRAKIKGVEGGILAPVAPTRRKLKIGSHVKVLTKGGKLELSL